MNVNRRSFLVQAGAASLSTGILATPVWAADGVSAIDRERMRSAAAFTAETLSTDHPVPFGADIVSTATGERLMRAVNRVGPDHDPSAHAETLTIRLACEIESDWTARRRERMGIGLSLPKKESQNSRPVAQNATRAGHLDMLVMSARSKARATRLSTPTP